MKSLVVLVCSIVLVQSLTDEQKEKLKWHHAECMVETGVDPAVVAQVMAGDYTVEDEGLKKFSLCVFIKAELMTKKGEFKKDIALAKVPVPEDVPALNNVIDACLAIGGENAEQKAWNFIKCYQQSQPKHSIL